MTSSYTKQLSFKYPFYTTGIFSVMSQDGIYLENLKRKHVLTLKNPKQNQSVPWDYTTLFRCANQA